MSSYLDRDFNPKREFWNSMTRPLVCIKCGYKANGRLHIWDLLENPVDAECYSCGKRWSVAIPLGDCKERRDIHALLEAEKRFYKLRDELADIIDYLHGRR